MGRFSWAWIGMRRLTGLISAKVAEIRGYARSMKSLIAGAKSHLQPYSIIRKRKTTVSHMFAAARAGVEAFSAKAVHDQLLSLGQIPDEPCCVYCGRRQPRGIIFFRRFVQANTPDTVTRWRILFHPAPHAIRRRAESTGALSSRRTVLIPRPFSEDSSRLRN